jgi:hypothetical protein
MKTKTKVLLGTAAAAVVGIALATPIVNLASPILSSGSNDQAFNINGFYQVEGGYYKIALTTNRPSSIETQVASYSAGGENGWHSHAGLVAVTLVSGTIDWYDANCNKTTYTAGQIVAGGQSDSLLQECESEHRASDRDVHRVEGRPPSH